MSEQITAPADEQTVAAPARIVSRKGALKPCTCSDYVIDFQVDGQDEPTETYTGCTGQTNRLFKQGHDAKLVSFLIQGELNGGEIWFGRNTGERISTDAITACSKISDALGQKAEAALNKAKEKLIARLAKAETKQREQQAKANKKASRQAPAPREVAVRVVEETTAPVEPEDATRYIPQAPVEQDSPEFAEEDTPEPQSQPTVKIKVGRWPYDATVNEDASATYTNRDGAEVTVPAGKWKLA